MICENFENYIYGQSILYRIQDVNVQIFNVGNFVCVHIRKDYYSYILYLTSLATEDPDSFCVIQWYSYHLSILFGPSQFWL